MARKSAARPALELLIGGLVGVERSPNQITGTKTIVSPEDPAVQYVIKKATNNDDVARRNMFSKMRYIQLQGEDSGYATERDYPQGDAEINTIKLCLVSWNLEQNGKPVPINESTILAFMLPVERVLVYDEIMALNDDIWGNRPRRSEDSEKS